MHTNDITEDPVVAIATVIQVQAPTSAKPGDEESLFRIEGPAGINIHARSPQEIALSVLAEVVQLHLSLIHI